MLLLLNRHAHAGMRDPAQWPDDRDRPLTEKGRKVQTDVSRFLRKRDFAPTLVLTSPWTRARQTAEILVQVARVAQPPVPCDPLADDPDLVRLQDYVGNQPPEAVVALVGHSPWMEELASVLLAGSSAGLRIDFPKAGAMGIDLEQLEPGAGELRFFLRPRMV
ncbi:MAG TPA: histidine phosphatase family protein [Gemmatimonadales bacterium]|jgi:phosphohistidine phosphatase|nr:histidine phosphatase family protein [Gemmatimonadales bacterium]